MSSRSPSSVSPKSQPPNAVDPDIARLNIPKSAIQELQALVNAPRKAVEDRGNTAPRERIFASILTMITVAVAAQAIIGIAVLSPPVAGFGAFCTVCFLRVWIQVHGRALCRRRIALVNERNFLDTYQVHNREFGHLFQPEPDTPGGPSTSCCGPPPESGGESPVQTIGKELIDDQQQNQFQDAVTQHYSGMYTNVKRVQAELSLLDRANKANADSGRDVNAALEPANIPLPGEEAPKRKES